MAFVVQPEPRGCSIRRYFCFAPPSSQLHQLWAFAFPSQSVRVFASFDRGLINALLELHIALLLPHDLAIRTLGWLELGGDGGWFLLRLVGLRHLLAVWDGVGVGGLAATQAPLEDASIG